MHRVLVILLVLSSLAVPLSAQSRVPSSGPTELRPGDTVKITVWQRPELSGDFDVALDGTIVHPLYREIRVTGIPVEQVEERVRSFLSRLEASPNFVVQPLISVTVLGAVSQPDVYHVPAGATIARAVAMAGGVVEEGDPEDVKLIRNGSETKIDLRSPAGAQVTLRSGDEIIVERGGGSFFREVFLPVVQVVGAAASIIRIAQGGN